MSVAIVNPFDPKTVLLAKHAQHVVLVHFPIALLLTAAGFDFAAQWMKKPVLATVARYNVTIAAIATLPVMLTGLLAWQHLVLGITSSLLIWLVWWMHHRAVRNSYRLPVELLAALVAAVTAHLGGFLSGINTPV